ncbi:BMP family ABC transporter substrate-binding protein [Streptomyces sp. NPDC005969]|uniref:BMP family ABC transporter substrate-binding protein n=1 Tax=Streptomyces sp. NPDC005969 TaxID=3156722 RepID=UPI00340C92A5
MRTRRHWRKPQPPEVGRRARIGQALAAAAPLVRGRQARLAWGGVLLVGCVLLGARWFGDSDTAAPPDARARQYRDFNACLLTGDKGIVPGSPAAPVWKGMQQASADTRARVTYVPVMGEQTAANVQPHMNSLMQRQCGIVLTIGRAQGEAARSVAKQYPEVPFVVVGGAAAEGRSPAKNLTVLAPDDDLPDKVARAVRQAVNKTAQ